MGPRERGWEEGPIRIRGVHSGKSELVGLIALRAQRRRKGNFGSNSETSIAELHLGWVSQQYAYAFSDVCMDLAAAAAADSG